MCEVTRDNFDELLPQIKNDIDKSIFVAVDAEFSGMVAKDLDYLPLTEDAAARYRRVRENIQLFTLTQFGLSTFVYDRSTNSFQAHSYNFYLFPSQCGNYDPRIMFQSSSVTFLQRLDFDFNKVIFEGIPFLNSEQEESLRRQKFKRSFQDIHEVKKRLQRLIRWLSEAIEGSTLELGPLDNVCHEIFKQEIKKKLPEAVVDSEIIIGRQIVTCLKAVPKATSMVFDVSVSRGDTEHDEDLEMEEIDWTGLVDEALGFTKVFRHLCESKKPIVGHNLLHDLMFLYEKFHAPLPERYEDYKREIHRILPSVYDTKLLYRELKKNLSRSLMVQFSSLDELYYGLKSKSARFLAPKIGHADNFSRYNDTGCLHEAGYDAYVTGFVFLRFLHLCVVDGVRPSDRKSIKFSQYINLAQPHKNRIPLSRACMPYFNLEGPDPEPYPLVSIHVSLREGADVGLLDQLPRLLAGYGFLDVEQLSPTTAKLVSASGARTSYMLEELKDHPSLILRAYRFYDHPSAKRAVKIFVGVALTVLGGIGCYCVCKK
ncbi:poly(A)-specific ribonuclease PNLDC1-like [Oscarella lobularis]|uniref:poly(A)-specific ribonuclease PNLDC1-like n=1 Tax=Oscarella lobularis TaxID=121494 RepID=UPI0033132E5B